MKISDRVAPFFETLPLPPTTLPLPSWVFENSTFWVVVQSVTQAKLAWRRKLIPSQQINIYGFFKLIGLCMRKSPKITSLIFLWNILRKKWVMQLIFWKQISIKVSYELIPWFWWWIIKHSKSSQNSKFTIFLQYLKKAVKDETDFLHSDKHPSFPQVDFSTLGIKFSYKVILSYWWAWPLFLSFFPNFHKITNYCQDLRVCLMTVIAFSPSHYIQYHCPCIQYLFQYFERFFWIITATGLEPRTT